MIFNKAQSTELAKELVYKDNHLALYYLTDHVTVLAEAISPAIPYTNFQHGFRELGELIRARGAYKLIFDKRQLREFHEHSMVWYHLKWKEEMYQYGLRSHRKILPDNPDFIANVEVGRQTILSINPEFDFSKFDIQYFDSVQACLEN